MSQVDDILLPLPKKGVSHAVLFFEDLPDSLMTQFTKELRKDYPKLQPLNPERWAAAPEPRPISFGEVFSDDPDGGWNRVTRWHVLIDSEGVAPEVKEAILEGPQSADERVQQRIVEKDIWIMPGEPVNKYSGSHDTLGTMVLRYESMQEMLEMMDNMEKDIRVVVQ